MPDMSMFAKMLGSMGLDDLDKDAKEMDGKLPEMDDEKVKEAQKMFEDCMKGIEKDIAEHKDTEGDNKKTETKKEEKPF